MDYFWLTIKHKWFVFIEGLRCGANVLDLLTHDLSKFGLKEYRHYQRQFFGNGDQPLNFSYAWLHHQKYNKHHWEYWVPVTGHNRGGYKDLQSLPMPKKYVAEMVADWMGAGWAYNKRRVEVNYWPWLDENLPKIADRIHPDTLERINSVLVGLGRNKLYWGEGK